MSLTKALVFSLVFMGISSLPFVFVPGRAGYFSIFEPRNLYILAIGSSLMLVIFSYILASLLSKKPKIVNFLTLFFLIPLLFFHIKTIQKDIKNLKVISDLRRSFLIQIQTSYPELPQKVIFYTQSDACYYGLPEEEKTLPVQSGFGRMLMIWYQEKENFPGCLYEDQFLHDLISQGYQECQGRGFGYFRDYNQLKEALRENNLSVDDVFAFSWKGKAEEFKGVSQQIREKLQNEKI